MQRRMGFVLSICGMMFVVMPMATVLRQPDFVVFTIGSAFVLLGIFFAMESVAKGVSKKS